MNNSLESFYLSYLLFAGRGAVPPSASSSRAWPTRWRCSPGAATPGRARQWRTSSSSKGLFGQIKERFIVYAEVCSWETIGCLFHYNRELLHRVQDFCQSFKELINDNPWWSFRELDSAMEEHVDAETEMRHANLKLETEVKAMIDKWVKTNV